MVRIAAVLLLLFSLCACKPGINNNDAVRQGVINHLTKQGLNVAGMDVNVTAVTFNGNQADATVSMTPKGGNPAAGMSMKYHMEQQNNLWVVTGRQDAGASPHGGAVVPQGGAATPGAENPHGAGGKMPLPEDLPPAKKK